MPRRQRGRCRPIVAFAWPRTSPPRHYFSTSSRRRSVIAVAVLRTLPHGVPRRAHRHPQRARATSRWRGRQHTPWQGSTSTTSEVQRHIGTMSRPGLRMGPAYRRLGGGGKPTLRRRGIHRRSPAGRRSAPHLERRRQEIESYGGASRRRTIAQCPVSSASAADGAAKTRWRDDKHRCGGARLRTWAEAVMRRLNRALNREQGEGRKRSAVSALRRTARQRNESSFLPSRGSRTCWRGTFGTVGARLYRKKSDCSTRAVPLIRCASCRLACLVPICHYSAALPARARDRHVGT